MYSPVSQLAAEAGASGVGATASGDEGEELSVQAARIKIGISQRVMRPMYPCLDRRWDT